MNNNNNNTNNIIISEELSNFIKYDCQISKSYIIYEINHKILSFSDVNFNWEYPKLVLNLIMYSFNDIIKKHKFDKFQYNILESEYEFLNKEKWEILDKKNDVYDLSCPIDIALENILYGFCHT
jgi:hypothetical protein